MSVLTKVFVVLVSILSVILVALIVPFVSNSENYRQELQDVRNELIKAQSRARLFQNDIAAVQKEDSQRVLLLEKEKADLVGQMTGLKERLNTSDIDNQQNVAKIATFEADWARLTAANQQHAQVNAQLQDELKRRREQAIDQQTKMIQLVDRNMELESQIQAQTRQVRRIREKLTQLEERNVDLEGKLAQLPPEWQAKLVAEEMSSTNPIIPQTPITGQITGVQTLGAEMFVQVNVGRNDGVEENMKFLVHRGDQFLGTLIVTTVDAASSAGRLELLQGEVAVGDAILTGGY